MIGWLFCLCFLLFSTIVHICNSIQFSFNFRLSNRQSISLSILSRGNWIRLSALIKTNGSSYHPQRHLPPYTPFTAIYAHCHLSPPPSTHTALYPKRHLSPTSPIPTTLYRYQLINHSLYMRFRTFKRESINPFVRPTVPTSHAR